MYYDRSDLDRKEVHEFATGSEIPRPFLDGRRLNQSRYVYDPNRPTLEDIDVNCEEHCVKALMYGLTRKVFRCRRVEIGGI
jgi:hypothetical protein